MNTTTVNTKIDNTQNFFKDPISLSFLCLNVPIVLTAISKRNDQKKGKSPYRPMLNQGLYPRNVTITVSTRQDYFVSYVCSVFC